MKSSKLNFRFHNPNTAESTADYILKIFVEADKMKLDEALKSATATHDENESDAPSPQGA